MALIRVYHNKDLDGYFIDSNDIPDATKWSLLYGVNFTTLAPQALVAGANNNIDGKTVFVSANNNQNGAPAINASGLLMAGGVNGATYANQAFCYWHLPQFTGYDASTEQIIVARGSGNIGSSDGACAVGFITTTSAGALGPAGDGGTILCGLRCPAATKTWFTAFPLTTTDVWGGGSLNNTDPPLLDGAGVLTPNLYVLACAKQSALSRYLYQQWNGALPNPNDNTLLNNRIGTYNLDGNRNGTFSQGAMLFAHGGGLAFDTTINWSAMSIWQRH